MKLVSNLYAYVWRGSDNNCNTYLLADVLNDRRHLLIDPGHITTPSYGERGLDTLARNMETDGLSMGAIGLIILTHAHSDHCEAARAIRSQSNVLGGFESTTSYGSEKTSSKKCHVSKGL